MKKLVLLLIIVSSYNYYSQTAEQLIKEGNKFYQQQNYAAAIDSYKKVLTQGFESGTLYYNLGNAFFKEGNLGYAIYNYEKGLKLEPTDEDLNYNLKLANARTVDKITEVPKLFIVAWIEGLLTVLSVTGWSVFLIVAFWAFLISIAVYFFARQIKYQRFAFLGSSISLALVILLAVVLFARVNRESSANYGILTQQVYSAKVSPDEKSNDAFVIHEGIKFTLEDEVGSWVKVRLIDGKIGWIEKDVFGKI